MPDILPLGDGSTTPRLAYDSCLDDATITSASPEESDGAVEHVADWLPWTFWRPTGAGPHVIEAVLVGTPTVNAVALAGHDADGSVEVETWDGSAWVAFVDVVAAGDGSVIYLTGTPVATTKLRFTFESITFLAVLYAGEDLILPEGIAGGWTDPQLALRAVTRSETTREGIWLGNAVEQFMAELTMSLKHVAVEWARDNWTPFVRTCCAQPFFLHWNSDDFPESACLCTGADFGGSAFAGKGFVDLAVTFKADPGLDRRLTPQEDVLALLIEEPEGPLLL